MLHFLKIVGAFLALKTTVSAYHILKESLSSNDTLQDCLENIYKERSFHAMLIVHPPRYTDSSFEAIYKFHVPKMIWTTNSGFRYKKFYNSEIMAILITSSNDKMDKILLENLAMNLQHMRHVRLLVLAENVINQNELLENLKTYSEHYKFTNVLLLCCFQSNHKLKLQFHMLKPYPNYHWQLNMTFTNRTLYFPAHWRNFENKTLVTLADQHPDRSYAYKDSHGNIQLSGPAPKFIQVFAERYNASLKMYHPIVPGAFIHFSEITKMVQDQKLDIPMSVDAVRHQRHITASDFASLGGLIVIVPCALPLTPQEIFVILCDLRFFAYLLIITAIFSLTLAVMDAVFNDLCFRWKVVLNCQTFRGVLGQSFTLPLHKLFGLSSKMFCFTMGIVGILIATLFSGTLHTLLTTPPYHRPIETFDDIVRSPIKILAPRIEYKNMAEVLKPFERSVLVSNNITFIREQRNNFNTAFGFYCTSLSWQHQVQAQKFYNRKIMCTHKGLMLLSLDIWGFRVQTNSPYLEALNFYLHRIHSVGLISAWRSALFIEVRKVGGNLMKLPAAEEMDRKSLNLQDLLWIWMLLMLGFVCSFVVFGIELWIDHRSTNK